MSNKNGQVPGNQLVLVADAPLWWGTAHAFNEAAAAAFNAGVGLAPVNQWAGYRDLELQAAMHAHPSLYGVPKGIEVAVAGKSTHGLGTAVDVVSGRSWLIDHGRSYGFSHPNPSNDPNHFLHDGKTAIGTDPTNVGPVVVLHNKGMKLMVVHYQKRYWLVGELTVTEITGHQAEYAALPQQTISGDGSFNDLVAATRARGVAYAKVIAAAVKA